MNVCSFPKEQKYVLASGWSLRFPSCISVFGCVAKSDYNGSSYIVALISTLVWRKEMALTVSRLVLSAKLVRLGPLFTLSSFLLQANILRTPSPLSYQPLFMLLLPHLSPAQSQNVFLLSFYSSNTELPSWLSLNSLPAVSLSWLAFLCWIPIAHWLIGLFFPNSLSDSGSVHYLFNWL